MISKSKQMVSKTSLSLKGRVGVGLAYIDNIGDKVIERYIGYRMKRLIKKADKLREKTGTQFFVVKINGKISLMSKREFKWKRQHGVFPKSFTADNLKKISYYYTRT